MLSIRQGPIIENGNMEFTTDRTIETNLCCLCDDFDDRARVRLDDEVLTALLKGLPGQLVLHVSALLGLKLPDADAVGTSKSVVDISPPRSQALLKSSATFGASVPGRIQGPPLNERYDPPSSAASSSLVLSLVSRLQLYTV